MDLFAEIVPEKDWHPNYAMLVRQASPGDRDILVSWAEGFKDRDGKFVREFQTTFNSGFWELYLHAVMRDRGLTVDFSHSSPDFVIREPTSFTVEAAIASHAKDASPEHDWDDAEIPSDLNEFNRQAIVRLSNALHAKQAKFKTHYAALPHVTSKPFVVALAPFDRPFFNLACQRAIEAVLYSYYVDEERWIAQGAETTAAPKELLSSVQKDGGAEIELGVFQNAVMPEVSAVIFSSCATWGKMRALSADPHPNLLFHAVRHNHHGPIPHRFVATKSEYQESLLDGLRVYHNPNATYPLDPAIFRSRQVMQLYYSQEAEELVPEQSDGQLMFRFLTQFKRKD